VKQRYTVTVAGAARVVELEPQENGAVRVWLDGVERVIEPRGHGGRYHWLDGTRMVGVEVEGTLPRLSVTVAGQTLTAEVADARAALISAVAGRAAAKPAGAASLRAPMPGRVVKILARAGDAVKAGGGVLVVEAMKMENELRAPRDGTVKELRVTEGAAVEAGQELAIVE
jgi:biotin carboxyl carrier protein